MPQVISEVPDSTRKFLLVHIFQSSSNFRCMRNVYVHTLQLQVQGKNMSKPKMIKVTVEDLPKKCKPQKVIIEGEEEKTETILVKYLAEKPKL